MDDFLDDFIFNHPLVKSATELGAEQLNVQKRRASPTDLYRKNMEAVQQMSWPRKVYEASAHEVDKLGAGTMDLVDTLRGMGNAMVGDEAGVDAAIKRQMIRSEEQAIKDENYKAFSDNAGLPAKIVGGMLPYIISGRLLGPGFVKGASKALDTADTAVRAGAKATGRASKSIIELMAEGPGPVGVAGRKLHKEFVQPLSELTAQLAKQVKPRNPLQDGIIAKILGDTVLGGVEGGLHYDNSIADGAIASGAGSIGGQMLKPMLHRMPSFYGEPKQELIKWGKNQGFQFLPGFETGHRGYQMFENDLRSSGGWADIMHQSDLANKYISNRVAFEQLGIPEKTMKEMTPKLLTEHLDNIKAEYNDLVSKTKGWLRPSEVQEAKDAIARALKESPKRDLNIVKKMTDDFETLTNKGLPTRDPLTGRMKATIFEGDAYQDYRSKLKAEIDKAYTDGNLNLANSLKPLLKTVDQGIENGIRSKGGEANVAQWKDINERYALSKLIINHGMGMDGMIDAKKLGRHLMASDAERMLTEGAGPRMNNLYKLSKLQNMMDEQANNGLASSLPENELFHNPGHKTVTQRMLQTPFGVAPGLRTAYAALYRRGYPARYGLLGLNGEGLYNAPLYTRAAAQASQIHPKLLDAIEEGYRYLSSIPGRVGTAIRGQDAEPDFLEQYLAQ